MADKDTILPIGFFKLHPDRKSPTAPIDESTIRAIDKKLKELRLTCKLENEAARELLLGELRQCLMLQAHYDSLISLRTISANEGAVKNSNTKNIIKLLGLLGADKLKEPEEKDPFADSDE